MRLGKSLDQIAEDFERNEVVRKSVRHSSMMQRGQERGNKTRLRNRELERAFSKSIKNKGV